MPGGEDLILPRKMRAFLLHAKLLKLQPSVFQEWQICCSFPRVSLAQKQKGWAACRRLVRAQYQKYFRRRPETVSTRETVTQIGNGCAVGSLSLLVHVLKVLPCHIHTILIHFLLRLRSDSSIYNSTQTSFRFRVSWVSQEQIYPVMTAYDTNHGSLQVTPTPLTNVEPEL